MYKSILKRTVSIITIIAVFATMFSLGIAASAETSASSASITYSFSGTNASDAGYAEGVITLSSSSSGTYELYWADDEKALDDYYSLAALEFNSSGSKSVKMAYHTAIPANATKLIATKSSKKVSEADAVFSIPTERWRRCMASWGYSRWRWRPRRSTWRRWRPGSGRPRSSRFPTRF